MVLKKSCIFSAMNKTNDDTTWNDSDNSGNVRCVCVCVWEMKALTVKMETLTLISTDRMPHSLCIKCIKLMVKYVFSKDVLFLLRHLTFG